MVQLNYIINNTSLVIPFKQGRVERSIIFNPEDGEIDEILNKRINITQANLVLKIGLNN